MLLLELELNSQIYSISFWVHILQLEIKYINDFDGTLTVSDGVNYCNVFVFIQLQSRSNVCEMFVFYDKYFVNI